MEAVPSFYRSKSDLFTISIDLMNDLSQDAQAKLIALSATVYPPDSAGSLDTNWAPKEWQIGMWTSSGQLVCHVGILLRKITIAGQSVHVGGIGNVMTHPDYRLNGLAAAALKTAIAWLRAKGDVSFALLGCYSPMLQFYQKLGWTEFKGSTYYLDHGERVMSEDTIMLFPIPGQAISSPSEGEIDLNGLAW